MPIAPAALLGGCRDTVSLSIAQGVGPAPAWPELPRTLIVTVEIAAAVGWPEGQPARDGSLLVADDVGDSVWRVSLDR